MCKDLINEITSRFIGCNSDVLSGGKLIALKFNGVLLSAKFWKFALGDKVFYSQKRSTFKHNNLC